MLLTAAQVEGEAQAEDDVLHKFMKDVESGPSHSTVDKVEKQETDVVDAAWVSAHGVFLHRSANFRCTSVREKDLR